MPLSHEPSQRQTEIVVGTVAPLRPEKNIGRLIEAFSRVVDDPRLRLVIAGDGPERPRLEQITAERGLAHRVKFLGHTSRPEEVLTEFDIFALSSDTEQIPNTVLEAMATGLPIAAVDVGDVRIMVAPENRPYIVPRDDAAGLSRSLSQLAAAPLVRLNLGVANRQQVEKYFRQEMMFQHYERLLLESGLRAETPPGAGTSSSMFPASPVDAPPL
jgi:glycosyltransferase involved in cell wall biosynthesis